MERTPPQKSVAVAIQHFVARKERRRGANRIKCRGEAREVKGGRERRKRARPLPLFSKRREERKCPKEEERKRGDISPSSLQKYHMLSHMRLTPLYARARVSAYAPPQCMGTGRPEGNLRVLMVRAKSYRLIYVNK